MAKSSKYREFLNAEDQEVFDSVIGFQEHHRAQLKRFRKQHLALIWKGRDEAKRREKAKRKDTPNA